MTIWLRTTESTMRDAAALAAKGEPHGTVVVAETQTAGVGRHGNSWHSEPGGGLYISIILRQESQPTLTMALGLAVQEAVDRFAGVTTDIRWPNDVLLNDRKIAGVMVQTADQGALIAGIGINVNQTEFPEDLRGIATSLLIETGHEFPSDVLLEQVVAESLRYASLPKQEVLRRFEDRSTWVRGKRVEVDGKFRGVTAGLTTDGFLLVSTSSGMETVYAGGVRAV